MNVYKGVESLVGRTPILALERLEKSENVAAKIYAKLEYLNPTGSVKDRAALQMIEDAIAEGKINAETVLIEPTSGNTGIGLAAIAAAKGLALKIVMPDSMSLERRKFIAAYGADLVLTEGKLGMKGAIQKAEELSSELENSFVVGQFTNPSNVKAHYLHTGPEILEDMDGDIDILVAGIGSGGTLTGVSKFLKEKLPKLEVVAVEPKGSPILSGGEPGPHKIQGIGAGFVPEILDVKLFDRVAKVENEAAFARCREVAKREGVFLGISSGAAIEAALEEARKPENKGKKILVICPDSGDRYLSSDIFTK